MKSLVFGVDAAPVPVDAAANRLQRNLAATPMAVQDLPEPAVRGDDWTVLRTRLCGICGSDSKQVLMDFDDSADNIMTALISFPQVLGHEVVATVESAGTAVDEVSVGDRVVLSPSLGCAPRGIDPPCGACRAGDFSLCANFTIGGLTAGIHSGNSSEGTGGFAELLPAHRSMVISVPDDVSDEVAVLADPFSVALHAVTRNPPPRRGRAMVYGSGALGSAAIAILRSLYPDVEVIAVARWEAQRALASQLGAEVTSTHDSGGVIDEVTAWSGGQLHYPYEGRPFAHPGGIDVVYDTIGSPETVEVALRVLKARGTLVQLGVSSPGRFEWTPWYFKELRLVGSNAFGMEVVDGRRAHAIEHYLELVRSDRIDIASMLTHRFRLEEWRDAFDALCRQNQSGAIKVAFDFR